MASLGRPYRLQVQLGRSYKYQFLKYNHKLGKSITVEMTGSTGQWKREVSNKIINHKESIV